MRRDAYPSREEGALKIAIIGSPRSLRAAN